MILNRVLWIIMQKIKSIIQEIQRTHNGPAFDVRIITILLVTPIILTILYYYGLASYYLRHLQDSGETWFGQDWPYLGMLPYVYMCGMMTLLRIVVPVSIIIFIFRDKLSEYGWRITGTRKHLPLYFTLYLLCLPFVYFASTQTGFLHQYPIYKNAALGGWHFWGYEAVYMLQFISVEAFFRGFILFGLARHFGYYAILIMLIPYCMIHFGKPMPEALASIFAGALLGYLALRSGSFYLGVLLHAGVALTMDLLALYQKGAFQ